MRQTAAPKSGLTGKTEIRNKGGPGEVTENLIGAAMSGNPPPKLHSEEGKQVQSAPSHSPPSQASQERDRIGAQLRRIATVGFLRLPGRDGQAEYIAALADLDPDLLELAVSRFIQQSTNRFFPFPGELRALVQEELHRRASQLFRNRRQRTLEDMRNRGIFVIEASE